MGTGTLKASVMEGTQGLALPERGLICHENSYTVLPVVAKCSMSHPGKLVLVEFYG